MLPEFVPEEERAKRRQNGKKSSLQHWLNATFDTVAEISDQIVSARDDL